MAWETFGNRNGCQTYQELHGMIMNHRNDKGNQNPLMLFYFVQICTNYLTQAVTNDLNVEVSQKIKEEFQNGKEYDQYHGKELAFLPSRVIDKPNGKYLDWHNTNIYKG